VGDQSHWYDVDIDLVSESFLWYLMKVSYVGDADVVDQD
jgi:hypothetical protein